MSYYDYLTEPEEQLPQEPQPAPEQKHSPLNVFIGIVVILLACFGVYQLAVMGVDLARSKKNDADAAQTADYYSYVIPVAAINMAPFEDVAAADMNEMVELSVWAVLNSALDSTQYQYSGDYLLLPEGQVTAAFVHFFGMGRAIVHATVSGYGYEFTYDAAAHVYKIPLTTITPVYAPTITDTETKGDSVVLTVGYLNTGLYTQNSRTGELSLPEPDRYVKVTLRTASTGTYISSVRALGLPETAVPAQQPTAASAVPSTEEASSEDASGEEESSSGDETEAETSENEADEETEEADAEG